MDFSLYSIYILGSTASPLVNSQDGTTIYSGAWTAKNPTFSRDQQQSGKRYSYEAIEFNVSTMGTYTLTSKSQVNTYGYIYDRKFNPSHPDFNLIVQDDDSDGEGQFKIVVLLHPGHRYVLVATTSSPEVTGKFSIVSSGPTAVNVRSKSGKRMLTNAKASKYRANTILPYEHIFKSSLK